MNLDIREDVNLLLKIIIAQSGCWGMTLENREDVNFLLKIIIAQSGFGE
jgi:hypothetical protein